MVAVIHLKLVCQPPLKEEEEEDQDAGCNVLPLGYMLSSTTNSPQKSFCMHAVLTFNHFCADLFERIVMGWRVWSRRTEMSSIMEQQGVRQGRRRAKKTEFRWSKLLLLLCFFSYSGTSAEHVTGIKGGSVTLSCELQDHEISVLVLSRRSKNILVCQNDECKNVNDSKVFKKGSCDIMLKDLIFSDAGKYILRVYHNNTQAQVEQQAMEYHLHIHDEISVEIDEKVQLDVLIIDADKVEHQNINSTEWTEVWTRGHGFSSDRLTVRDGNLIILQFTVTDTGTYRVLDSNNEILITVTVTITESSPQSKGEVIDTEQHAVESWIIVVSVIGVLLVVALISAVFCICRRQHKNTEHERIEYYTAVQNI